MSKGKYTRKQAGLLSFKETTGEELPASTTCAEIREYVRALPEDQRRRCHKLYLHYMSLGRPDYMESYDRNKNLL